MIIGLGSIPSYEAMNGPKNWNVAILTHFDESLENFLNSSIRGPFLISGGLRFEMLGSTSTAALRTPQI